ncbi:uncharacterized protein LOC134273729 [Saccostrea cucullata]|uniref:uncharacterized protein LOC134273729 n=1 Tax=Saccostrea cuccullata TaxID=36930 RepID=UPI002ED078C6
MATEDLWKDFKVSLRIMTKHQSTRRRVRDITGVFDFTHSISPQIMQYILTKDCCKFKDHLQSRGYSLEENKHPIEICHTSDKNSVENLEECGDELCDVISHFTIDYDVRTIVFPPDMDFSSIDDTLSSSQLIYTWNEKKNLLFIYGEYIHVENVYKEMQKKNEGLWTYPQNADISLYNEDEKNVYIVVSTEVKSHIAKMSSLTINVLPYVCHRRPLLWTLSADVVQSSMKDTNKMKGQLDQPTIGELEITCLSVLNSFISFTSRYICRSLQVPTEIQQDVKTKLTGLEDLSIVWDEDGNILWVSSTKDKFQFGFEKVMKVIQESKFNFECAQAPVIKKEEQEDQEIENATLIPSNGSKTSKCGFPSPLPSKLNIDTTTEINGITEDSFRAMSQWFGKEEKWIALQPVWNKDKVLIKTTLAGDREYFKEKLKQISAIKELVHKSESHVGKPTHRHNRFQNYEDIHVGDLELTTNEGIILKVYCANIVTLEVDCIVNAGNENLMHGAGVSLMISNAAGLDFDRECESYVKKNGPLKTGACCTTISGKLSRYKFVIHTAGPRWGDFRFKEKCREILRQSIYGCLQEATYRHVKSIAFPPVSTGKFGIPTDICAEEYLSAVLEFSAHYGYQTELKEIHFIDLNTDLIKCIQHVFRNGIGESEQTQRSTKMKSTHTIIVYGASRRTTVDTLEFYFDNARRSGGGGVTNVMMDKDNKIFYVSFNNEEAVKRVLQRRHTIDGADLDVKLSVNPEADISPNLKGLSVKIYTESIMRAKVECIVNSANENLMHGGGVASAISEAAGYEFDQESSDYVKKNGPLAVGKCCVTTAGKLPYKCVIHTVGPRWHDYQSDEKALCLAGLQEAVEVSFREADKLAMKSIALPAISSGIFGVPREKCAECYYKAVCEFAASYPRQSLQEIHFVDRDSTMIAEIQNAFKDFKNASK